MSNFNDYLSQKMKDPAFKAEYDALDIALEELAAAHGQLQARFSPALNARAGALMSALTGGKYGGVTLNRDFEALAAEAGAGLPRRAQPRLRPLRRAQRRRRRAQHSVAESGHRRPALSGCAPGSMRFGSSAGGACSPGAGRCSGRL